MRRLTLPFLRGQRNGGARGAEGGLLHQRQFAQRQLAANGPRDGLAVVRVAQQQAPAQRQWQLVEAKLARGGQRGQR